MLRMLIFSTSVEKVFMLVVEEVCHFLFLQIDYFYFSKAEILISVKSVSLCFLY